MVSGCLVAPWCKRTSSERLVRVLCDFFPPIHSDPPTHPFFHPCTLPSIHPCTHAPIHQAAPPSIHLPTQPPNHPPADLRTHQRTHSSSFSFGPPADPPTHSHARPEGPHTRSDSNNVGRAEAQGRTHTSSEPCDLGLKARQPTG